MISTIDVAIILVYLAAMLAIGFFVGRKETADDFFVNRRKTRTALLVFTLVSTSAGMGTFLGISAAAYETGVSY
ncbi:hypothetical protein HZB90_04705, partial [archaeon]|nr:hypothetical protein [archaeon]